MRNIKLTVAYDGTQFAGWQRQSTDPTIQQVLEEALASLTKTARVVVHGSGRTDAGVHAVGQVANFRTEASIPTDAFPPALNRLLPNAIVVTAAEEVNEPFHARKSARSKRYRYTIDRALFPSPTKRLYALTVRDQLDVGAMRDAARMLLGEHDFSAFESKSIESENSVRTVLQLDIMESGTELLIDLRANGFLYNMVRAIVGTLLEVGRGKRTADQVGAIVASRDRAEAGPTAPAKGLCLMEVDY